jgi:acetyl esterase
MALSQEVLDNMAYAEQMGYTRLDQYPPAETREMMKQAPPNPHPTPVGEVINTLVPGAGIPVRIYIPAGEGPFPVVAYFHGGGFVLMSLDTHDEICRQLCARSGCAVMSVDYPLAPEHPYPQGPEGCVAATRWLIDHAGQFKGLGDHAAVAGDSAGGYMALYTAQRLTASGIPLRAEFAAYPVTDHYSAGHPSWEENKTGYTLTAGLMKWFWDAYTPDASTYADASILRAPDFSKLPPALIMTANYDPLRDEGKAYADKLTAAGVPTVYRNYENVHGFLGAGTMGEEALDTAAAFLKEKLKP